MAQSLPNSASGTNRQTPRETQSESANPDSALRDELLGRTVGAYQLVQRLGGGAMASVYRATDLNSGESVALKLLLPGADQSMRERFRREMRTVSQLSHAHIVQTFAVSPYEGEELAYIAMELVEGESLGQLLERSGQLSMIDSCALLASIAQALAYAHKQGVVHRDVKPSNILLRRSTWGDANAVRIAAIDRPVVPLLSDFGIALILDAPELTSAGRTIGTPAYMAPEQCSGSREVDGRADIYALGAVLFRCLIGRPLFLGNTTQILHAHVYEPVSIPDDNMRLLSPLVVEILTLALTKTPEERYEDAAWLAEDLAVAAGQRVRSAARKNTGSEATATMSVLPTANPSTKTSSHILVPAPKAKGDRTTTERPTLTGASMEVLPEEDPVIPLIPPKTKVPATARPNVLRRRGGWQRSNRWLAAAITALVALLAISGAIIMWPSQSLSLPPSNAVSSEALTPSAVALASVTNAAIAPITGSEDLTLATSVADLSGTAALAGEDGSNVATVTPASAVASEPAVTEASTPSAEASEATATPTVTVTVTPTVTIDADSAFAEAQIFFDTGEWSTAVEYLVELRQKAPGYSPDSVSELLGESYLLLAAVNNQQAKYTETIELLRNAQGSLAEQPIANDLLQLTNRTRAVVLAESASARDNALQALQKEHQSLADQLVDAGAYCASLVQLDAAKAVYQADVSIDTVEAGYRAKCDESRQVREQQTFVSTLTGNLLYSAQVGNDPKRVNIYRQSLSSSEPPTLLIANARYPAQQRSGSKIAYFNTGPAPGLYEFDPTQIADANERGKSLASEFTEDGRDSPSSWNYSGDMLVFASTRESDRRSRLYLYLNNGSASTQDFVRTIAFWPAWRPVTGDSHADWIVYNGTNDAGNEPGLRLVTNDGMPIARITDRGDDIAPVWTADGSALFFMNSSRSGNWDIYQVPVGNSPAFPTPSQFVDSPAQDVMPAVSPDGRAVAFVSDRGGQWQIWVMPIGGGEPTLLANLEGRIPDPTEQSMQWVR